MGILIIVIVGFVLGFSSAVIIYKVGDALENFEDSVDAKMMNKTLERNKRFSSDENNT